MRLWSPAVVLGLLLGLTPCARAVVVVNCTVSSGGIAFGIYNPLSGAGLTSTGSLLINCSGSGTGSTSVTVGVSLSTGLSGTYATRKMLSGLNALNYNIFWETTHQNIMGDGTGGSHSGSGGPITVFAGGSVQFTGTMYGLIPALQDVAPGSYADVIVVTVTY
jgi:spore coat protein U-like protein